MEEKEAKEDQGLTEAGEVCPGSPSFSCLDARKGSEKKIKASPRPGKFGEGIRDGLSNVAKSNCLSLYKSSSEG